MRGGSFPLPGAEHTASTMSSVASTDHTMLGGT